jgi:hypothetical protein
VVERDAGRTKKKRFKEGERSMSVQGKSTIRRIGQRSTDGRKEREVGGGRKMPMGKGNRL